MQSRPELIALGGLSSPRMPMGAGTDCNQDRVRMQRIAVCAYQRHVQEPTEAECASRLIAASDFAPASLVLSASQVPIDAAVPTGSG